MVKSIVFPLLLPLILISFSFWKTGVTERATELNLLQKRSHAAQLKLDELRAISVAEKIYQENYRGLVEEFSALTGLSLDVNFALSKGEVAGTLARFIEAVAEELRGEEYASERGTHLFLKSVTPGQRQVIEPFLAVDFEMNLEGRFFTLPKFLERLSHIAQSQKCSISVGELRVAPIFEDSNTGELAITLPLRVYFLER